MTMIPNPPIGPAASASANLPQRAWVTVNGRHRSIVLAYFIAIAMFLITSAFTPGFASPTHIKELLIEASFIGIVGLGQTFVIIGGGVDLSIPYVLCASGIILTILTSGQNGPLIWVIPVLILLGALVGLVNGIGIAILGISPIIMTLGMNVVVQGALLVYLGSRQASRAPPLVVDWTFSSVGPLPINTLIWLGLAVLATVALSWTTFGRRLYAVGTSRIVAQFSGVNVVPITIATYVICAVAAAIAGILYTGFVAQPYLGMGDPYLFASVAAVAVGGAPLIGGSGHYTGTIAGALVLTVLADLLPILNLDPGALQIVYGLTILVTVAAATVRVRGGPR
ncbi:MAG TPA: ABC transporter permease [Chloroflexota bacterium]|nr:ABC transporter permease [Chloroflexota bacterium]